MMGFDFVNGSARILGDGTHPLSYVSLFDVAAFAVLALTPPKARYAILELGWPENIAPVDVIQLFEQATGRRVTVEYAPAAALVGQIANARDPYEKSPAELGCL